MNAEQEAAFQAGSGVAPAVLTVGIAAIVIVLAFVWVMWIAIGTFRAWRDGEIELLELAWAVLRASIVLMVLGFYLR